MLWVVTPPAFVAAQETLSVTTEFDASRWLAPGTPLELRLNRPLGAEDGRLAVFIGSTDFTALFTATPEPLSYRPRRVRLPSGENELVVYLVSRSDQWQEIGRVPLRVLTPSGFEKADVTPKIAVNSKGQVLEGHEPADNRPPRPEFQDFGLNLGLQTEHVRSGWIVRTQSNYLGVTNRLEALRFAQRAQAAPRFDLSDYLVTVERGGGRATFTAGNFVYGSQRHIINAFDGRGLSARFRFGPLASLSLTGMSGSRLVGWSNPLGVGNANHRLLGGTLGLTPVRRRPELVQLEVSALDGATLPQAGFTQGAVIDAEKSRSWGVRLSASEPSQHLAVEAGFARTRFENPVDPLLARGATLTSLRPATRNAHYVDLSYNVLRSVPISPTLPLNLALTFRHERVDPLYRSVAAPQARADLLQNAVQLTTGLGQLNAQVIYSRGEDNLRKIPGILTTLSRSTTANLALPLGSLLGPKLLIWIPMVTYGLARIHQFGAGVPASGGFTPTQVPDQVSTNHLLGLQWQGPRWRAMYQLNRSFQDNRQPGRERADLLNQTHNVSLGLTPLRSLDLAVDGALERAGNKELAQHMTTWRVGPLVTWRFTPASAVIAGLSHTHTGDVPRTSELSNTDVRLELSQRLNFFRGPSGPSPAQLFVRYARLLGDRLVPPGTRDPRRNWSLNTGLTLSML